MTGKYTGETETEYVLECNSNNGMRYKKHGEAIGY